MPNRSTAPVLLRSVGVLLCLGLAACGEETPTPDPAPANAIAVTLIATPSTLVATTDASPATTPAAGHGVTTLPSLNLNSPTGLAQGGHQQTIPAQGAPTDAPFWLGHPAHSLLTFVNYTHGNTLHAPSISVYAVRDLQAFHPIARMRVEGLQQALRERPSAPRGVAVIDIYSGMQVLQIQPSYLSFHGGNGVRYITQYVDAAVPINNHELFYTFQGLSDDGQFLVSAILPLSAPGLPEDGGTGVAQLGGELSSPQFQTYMKQIDATLATLPPDQFSPALADLDRLIQSISIAP